MSTRTKLILVLAFLGLMTSSLEQWRRFRIERSQDQNILSAANRYGVDPALIKAVIWRESRFNPAARGGKGEVGLMQIMPDSTGSDWAGAQRLPGLDDAVLLNPVQNIDCGAWYLRKLLGRYQQTDNPIPYALADYNAGRRNALRWMTGAAATNSAVFIEQIGFPSTRNYVQAVMQRREKYLSWAAGRAAQKPQVVKAGSL